MTKQELIEENYRLIKENNRLKAALKEIYGYTSLKPLNGDRVEEEWAEKGNCRLIYVRHLTYIEGTVELTLDPDYYFHTDEERKAVIKAIQTP